MHATQTFHKPTSGVFPRRILHPQSLLDRGDFASVVPECGDGKNVSDLLAVSVRYLTPCFALASCSLRLQLKKTDFQNTNVFD